MGIAAIADHKPTAAATIPFLSPTPITLFIVVDHPESGPSPSEEAVQNAPLSVTSLSTMISRGIVGSCQPSSQDPPFIWKPSG